MKKFWGLFTCMCILANSVSMVCYAAEGDSVTITSASTLLPTMSLTAKTQPDGTKFKYRWLWSDSPDGEYKPVYKASEQKYMLSTMDYGKYIKAAAVNAADGDEVISSEYKTLTQLGPLAKSNISNYSACMTTPAENIFYVDGTPFVLLDCLEDENSGFYILADSFYGNKSFDENGYAKFDPDKEGNIGYYLNNEIKDMLPEKITDKIDNEHVWHTERGLPGGDCAEDYSFTAGISLLSRSEAEKYYGRYGWSPMSASYNWWLRTQCGRNASDDNMFCMMGKNETNKGNMTGISIASEASIRPAFYLNKEFFREVKVEKAGSSVTEILKERYTKDELLNIYTIDELYELGIIEPDFKVSYSIGTDTDFGAYLNADITSFTDKAVADYGIQWLYTDAEGKNFSEIRNADDEKYFLSTEDAEKYITVQITPEFTDGNYSATYRASSVYNVGKIGRQDRTKFSSEIKAELKEEKPENIFTVNGQKFILLNDYNDGKSSFFVMTNDCYGKYPFDEDSTQKFDVNDENNIGYFLNNEFLTEGNEEKKLPETVINHIDKEHVWNTEAGFPNGNCPDSYSFTAGVSLISKTEYLKYSKKIGWYVGAEWWLRTVRALNGAGDSVFVMSHDSSDMGNLWPRSASVGCAVRPVFYLDNDFFKDVKISNAGSNVTDMIRKRYSVKELINGEAGYTIDELKSMGVAVQPEAKDVKMYGNGGVNITLQGSYEFFAENGAEESGSSFGFESSSDGINFSTLSTNSNLYCITKNDMGKYLRFYVIPKSTDEIEGEKTVSRMIKVTQERLLTADEIFFSDGEKEIESLKQAKNIVPNVTFTNYGTEEEKAVILLYIYNKDNEKIAASAEFVSVKGGETAELCGKELINPTYAAGNYAKIIVLDSLKNMIPLSGGEGVIK